MKTIQHKISLETVIDEKHEVSAQLWALPPKMRMLVIDHLVDHFIVPKLESYLEELNKGGSHAIIRLKK